MKGDVLNFWIILNPNGRTGSSNRVRRQLLFPIQQHPRLHEQGHLASSLDYHCIQGHQNYEFLELASQINCINSLTFWDSGILGLGSHYNIFGKKKKSNPSLCKSSFAILRLLAYLFHLSMSHMSSISCSAMHAPGFCMLHHFHLLAVCQKKNAYTSYPVSGQTHIMLLLLSPIISPRYPHRGWFNTRFGQKQIISNYIDEFADI